MQLTGALAGLLTDLPPLILAEGGDFNPLELDADAWSLVFWTAVAFLLLLFLLTKYAWGPLGSAVRSREQRIRDDLDKAEQARREAEETREKHRLEMERVAQETKSLLDEARQRAESVRADIESQAKSEADAIVERARKTIEAEKAQALQEIKDQVVDLSVTITSRLLERSTEPEDHLKEADALLARFRE